MKNFFELLQSKTEKNPDRNFDQRFWARFDAEFGAEKSTASLWTSWLATFEFKLAFGAVAAAAVGAVMFMQTRTNELGGLDPALLSAMNEMEALSNEAEVIQGLEGMNGLEAEEVASLSDAEWDLLLNEGSST